MDLNENRVREIVRDEMHTIKVPERLASMEAKLDQKAEQKSIDKLEVKVDHIQQQINRDNKIMLGLIISILLLLIASLAKS